MDFGEIELQEGSNVIELRLVASDAFFIEVDALTLSPTQ